MNKRVESALNDQINKEAVSSQYYLAMASWAECNGLNGTAKFMYTHSDEERFHMLKLIKFVNERGGEAIIGSIEKAPTSFKDLESVFEKLLAHEIKVTESINNIVDVCIRYFKVLISTFSRGLTSVGSWYINQLNYCTSVCFYI